ncbi:Pr6Pr family membrane protein [Ferruginibacter sp. SUN106]|uniref:Pr6Pr family membrane protein n=1 Tax=Ferruginibacter sp. SUN106 TaxID=2978348 RepID=UPI003D364062
MQSSTKTFAGIGAVIVWLSLLLQLYVAIQNRIAGIPETIVRFFSYFTVESNILLALCFTMVYKKGITDKGNFFARANTLTAAAVYICIVALTYNLILRFQWAPTGLTRVPDELLHLIIPVIYLVFWFKFVPKQNIQWSTILPWTIFPLVYLGYSLLRGPMAQWYPYPFLDVIKLGYSKVLINSAGVCAVFVAFAVLFIGIAKAMSKRSA